MIAPLTLGTEHEDGRRVWSKQERFCALSYQVATGGSWDRLLDSGARVVVDATEAGTVMGWAFVRDRRSPFVYVCKPWLGTQVGEEIRDRLLRELGT